MLCLVGGTYSKVVKEALGQQAATSLTMKFWFVFVTIHFIWWLKHFAEFLFFQFYMGPEKGINMNY